MPRTATAAPTSIFGDDVDLVDVRPDPSFLHRECGRCGEATCRVTAHATWPVAYEGTAYEGENEAYVGRDCLPGLIDDAREQLAPGGTIAIDIPVWSATLAASEAGISYRQLDTWCIEGYVNAPRATNGARVSPRRFDAATVAVLKLMGALGRVDVGPRAAHRLISKTDPQVVDGLLAALQGAEATAA